MTCSSSTAISLRHKILHYNNPRFLTQKRIQRRRYGLSPHAEQVFCDLGIFAPHSTQYRIGPLSLPCIMPTDLFCIDDIYKNKPNLIFKLWLEIEVCLSLCLVYHHSRQFAELLSFKVDHRTSECCFLFSRQMLKDPNLQLSSVDAIFAQEFCNFRLHKVP